MEVDVDAGLPLVRLVEVLVDMVVLLGDVEEEEDRKGEVVLGVTGDEEEEEEEEGGSRDVEVCVVGGALETPVGEGRIGREYVRSAGVAVDVSFGRAGTRMWGDGVPAVAAASFGPWAADTEGAGVRGGGGEEVVGVSVGAGVSRSMGLGVRRGGVGVVGVEESAVVVAVEV